MGFQHFIRVGRALAVIAVVLVGGAVWMGVNPSTPWLMTSAHAYSYAAAGKEPLIDAREAALAAIGKNDWASAKTAMAGADDEITYLVGHHFPHLRDELATALDKKDELAFRLALRDAFVAEVERRLDGASQNLHDYQSAKVLVIKARRFLDAISADLNPDVRAKAEAALNDALTAVGNPGVFGVGARPADPEAFARAEKRAHEILAK